MDPNTVAEMPLWFMVKRFEFVGWGAVFRASALFYT